MFSCDPLEESYYRNMKHFFHESHKFPRQIQTFYFYKIKLGKNIPLYLKTKFFVSFITLS